MADTAGKMCLKAVGMAALLVVTGCSSYKEYILDQVRYSKGDYLLIVNMRVMNGDSDDDGCVSAKAGISCRQSGANGYVVVKRIEFLDHQGAVAFHCEDQRLELQKGSDGKFFGGYSFDRKTVKFGDFTAKGVVEVYDDKGEIVESFVIDGVIKSKMIKKNAWVSKF